MCVVFVYYKLSRTLSDTDTTHCPLYRVQLPGVAGQNLLALVQMLAQLGVVTLQKHVT